MHPDSAADRLRADLDVTDRRLAQARAAVAIERADLDQLAVVEGAVLAYHRSRITDLTLRAAIVCAIAETTDARMALRMMPRGRWLAMVAIVVMGRC